MIPSMFLWYLSVTGVLLALTLIAIIRRIDLRLVLSTGVFMAGLVLSYLGLFSLTGAPQPVWLMWNVPHVAEAEIVGGYIEENVGIFILLQGPGIGPTPKYYWFPYSSKAAESFQKAQRASKQRGREGKGQGILMTHPFEKSLEERRFEDLYHEPPQPANPDKPHEEEVIRVPTRPAQP